MNHLSRLTVLLVTSLCFVNPPHMLADPSVTGIPPLVWVPPTTFDPAIPGLGLPELAGIKNTLLYDPQRSTADQGHYESLLHGTYNHLQQFLVTKDKVIVYWVNHVQDENGPGQRILAKIGTIKPDGAGINWDGNETLTELAPAPMPAKRRQLDSKDQIVDGGCLDGTLSISNDKIYLRGRIFACDGWTNDMRFHNTFLRDPVPEAYYRSGLDKTAGYRWDIYWGLTSFIQQFNIVDGKLAPISPVYIEAPIPTSLQITPSLNKKVAALNPPYRDAKPLSEAPEEIRNVIAQTKSDRPGWQGYPYYAKGNYKLAANGKNGLSHRTQFQRPDGKWVIVRDNLLDSDNYYAAVKDDKSGTYPPGIRTNLFGTAMPVSGNLPDGSVWFVGSNRDRTDIYITVSKDGITFDKSWLLLHRRESVVEGVSKLSFGGPQYFQAITVGKSIWIVYSIGKEKIGLTEVPFAALMAP